VNGKLEGTSIYTKGELCVEWSVEVGEYFNYYDNPICAKYMVSHSKSKIGRKIRKENSSRIYVRTSLRFVKKSLITSKE